jgi:glycosyltransferase involved in cell wall biosynthesis
MRILFLTPEFPFPARSGGLIKSATLLEYMEPRHEVDMMCLRRRGSGERQVSCFSEVEGMPTDDGLEKRTPANLFRSWVAGMPLSIQRNRNPTFAKLVTQRSLTRYDSVFVDGWLMAQYVPPGFTGLRILHEHNAEYVMWHRQIAMESNPLRRALVRLESRRVRRYESSILGQFDVIFAVSEQDRQALCDLAAPSARVELLPNVPEQGLLDLPALSPPRGEPVCLFLGTLSWPPNLQGLRELLQHVLPLLRRKLPEAKLLIGGQGAPPDLAGLAERVSGVELVGSFDDPEPLYRQARAFVEIARGGSGTRVKVLNALARGLPVVATPDGIEGLDIRPGVEALVGSTPAEIADVLLRVLTDDAVWTSLAEGGRRLVRERFTPGVAFRSLDDVLAATHR